MYSGSVSWLFLATISSMFYYCTTSTLATVSLELCRVVMIDQADRLKMSPVLVVLFHPSGHFFFHRFI